MEAVAAKDSFNLAKMRLNIKPFYTESVSNIQVENAAETLSM